jgi:TolB protein
MRRAGALFLVLLMMTVVRPAHASASSRIVFSRLDGPSYHLYSVAPDGTGLRQLTNGPGDDTEADVSRDGRIVFSRGCGTVPRGPYTQLYIRERNGDVHPVFASASATADFFPRWSPDGRRILFTRASPGGELSPASGDYRIMLVNANGSGLRQLTPPGGGSFAAWSPDNRTIVYVALAGNTTVLVTLDTRGSARPRRLTAKDGYQPSWSPDGRRIAFTGRRDTGDWQVYVIDRDGRHEHRLTRSAGADKFPSWSPDGRSIVFESTREHPCPPAAGALCRPARLYVMRADGTGLHAITAGPADSYSDWTR